MRYIPHTEAEIDRMLHVIGAGSVDELFNVIPPAQRLQRSLDLPPALCEAELLSHLRQLGAANRPHGDLLVFCGAGCYPHAIPSAVSTLAGRSEFCTAYTPYQPELSQGTLLAIFEFQTMVCELLGMEVANASMYDGASALAEAILMARRLTRRKGAILASSVHPEYQATCETYLSGTRGPNETSLHRVGWTPSGSLNLDELRASLDDNTAAVVVQSPNFLGVLEDIEPVCALAHEAKALVIAVSAEPLAQGIARAPGDMGADIAVAEGGGLAGPPNLGGPGVGLFASRGKKAMRAMPGRIVGQTVDAEGRPALVLTLSTREQHIRRDKATSNICTNHGLMALRFTIHLALLGKTGFVELARQNLSRAAYARQKICEIDGFEPAFDGPFFNEFAIRVPHKDAEATVERAMQLDVVPGVALGRFHEQLRDTLLVSVNETHGEQDIQRLLEALR